VFQIRRARIGVGSSAAGVDRSGSSLQVLGAPILLTDSNGNGSLDIGDAAVLNASGALAAGSVYFTSYNDQAVGLDTNPYVTTPANGDWGGLEFRADIDRTQGYFQWSNEGIFLNYVNHADIRYGGGSVLINSVARTINPIHITDSRPTVTYNTISRSADASMSASPDSFEETNFHAPRYQRIAFTSDYGRIGPEIHHNQLVNNSVNGLFVRVSTDAGSTAQKLNVSGRWNETDIVHVMSENLAIAAQPGGVFDRSTAPPVSLVIPTAAGDGSATGGSLGATGVDVKYTYKLTYVDRFGYESPASVGMTKTITAANVAGKLRSVKFTQLPVAGDPYVARRLYRSENDGAFVLVAQLNRQDTVFVDNGKTRGGVLELPPSGAITLAAQLGGELTAGDYRYRVTYVDALGKESRPSDATAKVTIDGNPTVLGLPGRGSVLLERLPTPPASSNYVARRVYRSSGTGGAPYQLVGEIDATSTSFLDDGAAEPGAVLDDSIQLGRPDGRLAVDPSVVVKLDGARFELELGAQLIAEGDDGREIIFTSIADDRYGAGGTFDAGNDGAVISGSSNDPQAGDWGGIYGGHLSSLNVDHAVFAYGGGVTRVEGTFTAFNVVEIMDNAEARIANSVFEFNSRGQGGQGETDRFGRGFNEPGVIFVRQAQPVIYNNTFRNNPDDDPTTSQANPNLATPAININVNALNYVYKRDTGRTTGPIDRLEGYRDNQGPLILDNQLDDNEINGMVVRGQTLTTQSVWDDTDIVHVLFDTVYVSDFHSFGGLALTSSPTESLVVKLLGAGAGFVANGIPHEIDDRIGGIIQVLGQPGSPVVLTSFRDDRHAAGTRPDGNPQGDTNNDGSQSSAQPGDWNSILLDEYSHDRNVETLDEDEARDVNSPGPNGSPDSAQLLGTLAPNEYGGDENRRLGFTVQGFLADAKDLDVYSFKGIPGTEVWIDLDRTTMAFDPIIELLDSNGQVVARSLSSLTEQLNPNNYLEPLQRDDENLTADELADPTLLDGEGRLMRKTPQMPVSDFYSANPRDAGLRVLLPGVANPEDPERPLTYHVRIRSNSPNLDNLAGGLTSGAYQLQIRLRELDEIGGSTVRYATIAYATNGVELRGLPAHSPLSGEATEDSSQNETSPNAQRLGNLVSADRNTISVGGTLNYLEDGNPNTPDVDFYEFDIEFLDPNIIAQYPYPTYPTVFDLDYANGLTGRPNASLQVYRLYDEGTPDDRSDDVYRLVYTARDGNVAEDLSATPGSSDVQDMLRGSIGGSDPFLGVVDLAVVQPPNEPLKQYQATFRVAVSADVWMPDDLDQFTSAVATNPDLRLEPIHGPPDRRGPHRAGQQLDERCAPDPRVVGQ